MGVVGDVTVIVGTFGDPEWAQLAFDRAIPSAQEQARVYHHHGETLAEARNVALAKVKTPWVVHLDADDELSPDYCAQMMRGTADLRAPSVSYIRKHHKARPPGVPKVAGHLHDCTADCLPQGNWLVIGTMVRTEIAQSVGWREWPCYEDWDFFTRCWLGGATIEALPEAVYRAHVRFDSRNRAPSGVFKDKVHRDIVAANFPPDPIAA